MSIKTALKNLRDARKEYQKQLKNVGKTGAKGIAEQLAEFLPPGWALKWTQYTPYFNDGDACTFSVHDAFLVPEDETDNEEEMYISTAIDRYGVPDKEKSYATHKYNYSTGKNEVVGKEYYTEKGFPAIDGYSVKSLEKLEKLWDDVSSENDLMEQAFGDHVEVIVYPSGKFTNDEYSHD